MADLPRTRYAKNGDVHIAYQVVGGGDLDILLIDIAARVAAKAAPSEVLASSTVRDLLAGSGVDFLDRGEHELKGAPGTWRLYAVNR